jgi:hypothetical protein
MKKRKCGVENEGNYEGSKIWEKQKELKMGVTGMKNLMQS